MYDIVVYVKFLRRISGSMGKSVSWADSDFGFWFGMENETASCMFLIKAQAMCKDFFD